MNREQAEKELREAKRSAADAVRRVAEVELYLKDNPEDIIMVPGNIHLRYGKEILFNDDTQTLYSVSKKGYQIYFFSGKWNHTPHKLISADRDNLEIEQVYHFTMCITLESKGELPHYGIWNGKGFISIKDGFPRLNTYTRWNYIFKAVPVEE